MRAARVILAAMIGLVGCGPESGAPCVRTSDCTSPEVCVDGTCSTAGPDGGGGDAGGSCTTDGDCDDGVGCTNDRCAAGACAHDPDHARCAAGTLCSRSDDCVPGRSCATNDECDDGIFCNGAEQCAAERCAPGVPVDCADENDCSADVCDEGLDTCEHFAIDARCDDGMYCNGVERCDVAAGCQAGTAPDCSDALDCTADACDEAADTCVAPVVADACLIAGSCYAQGATDGGDFCRSCDHALESTDWTVTCTASVGDDSFTEFVAGDFGRSRATYYAAADGTLRTIQRSDVNLDGYPDLVQPNYYNGSTRLIDSYVWLGSATGLDPMTRLDLPTVGAIASTVADLNHDGHPDIAFCDHHNNSSYLTDSYVYWGSAVGFSTTDRSSLPTTGCYGIATADFDRDGWLDLVFTDYNDGDYNTSSFVYFGGLDGFSTTRRTSLPTTGPIGACVGDLNDDGHVDVMFPGYYTGASYSHSAYIFWGAATGPDPSSPDRSIPTMGGRGCSIADIDADGDLDVAIANHYNGSTGFVNSVIYLGTPAGPSTMGAVPFGTNWAGAPMIADMDQNGALDVLMANAYNGSSYRANSQILYRTAAGTILRNDFFPTIGAYGLQVMDWDLDGDRDVVFSSHYNGTSYAVDTQHFDGSPAGPGTTATASFPGNGPLHLGTEYGNTFDRGWIEQFESRVFDAGAPVEATWLEVAAMVPTGTRLEVQVRSAVLMADLAAAAWSGPTGTDWYDTFPVRLRAGAHVGHPFLQYRLRVDAPNAIAAPVVDSVRIHFR